MREADSRAWALVRAGVLTALLALVAWQLAPRWPEITLALRSVELRAWPLVLSGAIVLFSYALLIEVWRRVVAALGGRMTYGVAMRIWCVSNLGKYVPGKIWSILAMAAMSERAGVSGPVAAASSLFIAVINVLAGFAVVATAGRDALSLSTPGAIAIVVLAAGVVLTPRLVPAAARWVGARVGRVVEWPPLPVSTIAVTFVGCAVAWVLYGVAFQLMVSGTVGADVTSYDVAGAGATTAYIAVFTASYLAGFLVLPAPGGLVVREGTMAALLAQFALTTVATGTVIVVLSRLWLTVFELIPGLLFLAFPSRLAATPRTPSVSQPTITTVEKE